MNKTPWTPSFLSHACNFKVCLDREFAKRTIQLQVPGDVQKDMNNLAKERLEKIGLSWPDPYSFHEDTYFIKQIYAGQGGVWLSTDHQSVADLVREIDSPKPVEFHSHNVDNTRQAYALMVLLDLWVEYYDAVAGL